MTVEEFTAITENLGTRATWFHFEVPFFKFLRLQSFQRNFYILTSSQGRIPDVILGCIQYLRRKCLSVRISVEIEKPGRQGLQELAEAADVVFYSKTWAQVH